MYYSNMFQFRKVQLILERLKSSLKLNKFQFRKVQLILDVLWECKSAY